MPLFLAIDAGGTSTRATVLDQQGTCLGFGKSGPGNPVSSGFERAIGSISEASKLALAGLSDAGTQLESVSLAMAGGSSKVPVEKIQAALHELGLRGNVMIESDLLAMYLSGTYHSNGYAVVSGTGAICARVIDFSMDRVADGLGWLVGDAGSGYWIGLAATQAVAAALDGRGAPSIMVPTMLSRLGVKATEQMHEGRPMQLQELLIAVYSLRPIELASFATLAFEAAAEGDSVAAGILQRAGEEILRSLAVVRPVGADSARLPLILGGSILRPGSAVRRVLEQELTDVEIIGVSDGLAGAASLSLRRAGIEVDAAVFSEIQRSLEKLRTS